MTNTHQANGLSKLVAPLMRLQVANRTYPKTIKQLEDHTESRDSSWNDSTGS